MVDSTQHPKPLRFMSGKRPEFAAQSLGEDPYDGRRLSYSNTFENPWKAAVIRVMELFTGKLRLLRLIRRFEPSLLSRATISLMSLWNLNHLSGTSSP